MTKDVRREEMSKFAALPGCTYNDEICFVGIEPIFLFLLTETYLLRMSGSNK